MVWGENQRNKKRTPNFFFLLCDFVDEEKRWGEDNNQDCGRRREHGRL